MRRPCVLAMLIGFALILAACGPAPTATPTAEPSQASPTVGVLGVTVGEVSLSARVIQLRHPFQGTDSIALTDETRIVSESGQEMKLSSIEPYMKIDVLGNPGTPGVLIATEITVVGQ